MVRNCLAVCGFIGALSTVDLSAAEKAYDPGVTDIEIKIGQTMPYSGPASSYGTVGKVEAAYFRMINHNGGINGRKINLNALDDGYSPLNNVEQVRRLVEVDQVLATFSTLGTPTNSAIVEYMNRNKVPQLFVASGATKWGDYEHTPWTIGWQPAYQTEGLWAADPTTRTTFWPSPSACWSSFS